MCGIFGQISTSNINRDKINTLAMHAKQRGMDSSGLIYFEDPAYKIVRADYAIDKLLKKVAPRKSSMLLGHSRLITNGLSDNQPVIRDNICALHNGIIVNVEESWERVKAERTLQIDSELIVAIAAESLRRGGDVAEIPNEIFNICKGLISCALFFPHLGKLLLFSNNGSLYVGYDGEDTYFSSEVYPLNQIGCVDIQQLTNESLVVETFKTDKDFLVKDESTRVENLIPEFHYNSDEESILEYPSHSLKRCTRCILPETMPFIRFDASGVCNYCHSYELRNKPKPKQELMDLVKPYRRKSGVECIVPFSGGRDSCYGLHLVVNELKLKPITYTYDWGMVTDLGRRNISRMCAEMHVENIIIAADISKKRKNISLNLKAWLKAPNLGMISILTAGDKHFFQHVETVKKQTGVNLNLWGINPLEVTYFKSGFLGMKPDFEEDRVYTHGISNQLRYQRKRFNAMLESPGYFNRSIFDTLSGEYYRSFTKKEDYFHIFDYWHWDENIVEDVLDSYSWERATDTSTTWRIGDGTAALYNYIYYMVAGFTEHDTFRSNQIREGEMSREKALEFIEDENRPRYTNIRWYLDTLGMDFKETIGAINRIPKLYVPD